MTPDNATDIARQAVLLLLTVSAPVLVTALLTALIIGVIQAATQVQENTVSFVPKLLAVAVAAVVTGPWVLERLVAFGREMFTLP
ncbi:MAG: flagellar biosynthetic protein FliQ [Planctomycetota bacterium]|nr:flagellar biosynthetic protein FliQ [Planctomycetota bacterium]